MLLSLFTHLLEESNFVLLGRQFVNKADVGSMTTVGEQFFMLAYRKGELQVHQVGLNLSEMNPWLLCSRNV